MANRGWDKVRKSIGLYPVPPIRPGGKWRPPGADLPPAPPPTAVQRVSRGVRHALVELETLFDSGADCSRLHPDFAVELADLNMRIKRAHDELVAWRTKTAEKLEKHWDDHKFAFHREQTALAAERREKYRLERLAKAKADRAKKKRELERARRVQDKSAVRTKPVS